MGIPETNPDIVSKWRTANPNIAQLWTDTARIISIIDRGDTTFYLNGLTLEV